MARWIEEPGVFTPWAQSRFVRKHSGLHFGLLMAVPMSIVMWMAILHMLILV